MVRSKRALRVEAIETLIGRRVAHVFKTRDWELLEEVARLALADAPVDLASTDPALYVTLRNAITAYHLSGWTNMTPERVRSVCRDTANAEDLYRQRAARGNQAEALRILNQVVPDAPPDPSDELEPQR